LHQRWYQPQAGYGQSRPAISNASVIFATGDGQIIARDPARGNVQWKTQIASEQVSGYNLLARSGVVVAPVAYETVGLGAVDGVILWRYAAPADTLQNPANPSAGYVVGARIDGDSSTAYLPAWGASVSALDIHTGRARWIWRVDPSIQFRSGAVGTRISGDTVFAAVWHFLDARGLRSEPWIVALDRLTGRELWKVVLSGFPSGGVSANGAPAVYKNLVILTARGGDTWAIDRTTQQVVWFFQAKTTLATVAEVEFSGDVAYVDGGDGSIYALRASDGTAAWRAQFDGGTVVDLLVTPRRVYATNGPTMFVFDRKTGQRVAQQNVPGLSGPRGGSTIGSAAAFANNAVFVTVAGGAWSFEEP
jgi:outer membrane protein assembly factor BamB